MDRTEIEVICRDLHPRLFRALALFCGSEDEAEDLTQETLIRLWARLSSRKELRSPESWAFTVGFNLTRSWGRRRSAGHRASQRIASEPSRQHVEIDAAVAEQVAVREALARLPPRQRAALVLRHLEDLSVATTAEILGCAPGTVKALTSQAVASLQNPLGRSDPEEMNE